MKRICLFVVLFSWLSTLAQAAQLCNGTICNKVSTSTTVEDKLCSKDWDGSSKKECVPTGATKGRCFMNKNNGAPIKSCAAKVCDNEHILWLTNTRKPGPQSQGICYSRSWLANFCDKGCGFCNPGEKCELNEISWENPGYGKVAAFVGEEACHCVKQQQQQQQEQQEQQPEEDKKVNCELVLTGTYPCPDGTTRTVNNKNFKLSEHPELREIAERKGYCVDTDMTVEQANELLKDKDTKAFIEKQLCGEKQPVVPNNNSEQSQNNNQFVVAPAKNKLETYFTSAVSGKRDVWKDAEGNFNSIRLASDLTAGVVLGTVGGVVSAVVIKNKQLEKGFDALHCSVGGQNIANWGDTFTVGLNR